MLPQLFTSDSIEVKYKAGITNNDINSVIKFCEKFKIKNGIVITKDIIEKRKINDIEIALIPAWFFLLYWIKDKTYTN